MVEIGQRVFRRQLDRGRFINRKFDETRLKVLPAGSFYTEPPNDNHFALTKDDGVTLYITGNGPTGTVYVNPADDPAKR